MVEDHQAVIEAHVTIRQFEIIGGAPGQSRLDEVLQVITPITEAAPQRKRQVQFIEQFVARHQPVQNTPGIPELKPRVRPLRQPALRTNRAQDQERAGGDKGVTRLG